MNYPSNNKLMSNSRCYSEKQKSSILWNQKTVTKNFLIFLILEPSYLWNYKGTRTIIHVFLEKLCRTLLLQFISTLRSIFKPIEKLFECWGRHIQNGTGVDSKTEYFECVKSTKYTERKIYVRGVSLLESAQEIHLLVP